MSREVVSRVGRVAAFLAALALCVGAGFEVGRAAAPDTPAASIDVPVGHSH